MRRGKNIVPSLNGVLWRLRPKGTLRRLKKLALGFSSLNYNLPNALVFKVISKLHEYSKVKNDIELKMLVIVSKLIKQHQYFVNHHHIDSSQHFHPLS